MFSVVLFASVLLASQVSALATFPVARTDKSSLELFARQSSDNIPTACQSTCQAYLDITDNCDSSTCTCTNTLGHALVTCAKCVVSQPGATDTDKQDQQALLDEITSECKTDGLPFSSPLSLNSNAHAPLVPSNVLAALSIVAIIMATRI